ncbi:MAG: hypothetical protein AAF969_17720 [Bacteroidota bacterium]
MITFICLFQQPDIEQKIKEVPDKAYEIGVVIGAFIPFLVLVGIAYVIYRYNKRRRGLD